MEANAELRVMYYDFDANTGKRPGNNSASLKDAASTIGLGLKVHEVRGVKSSRLGSGAEDLLLDNPSQYDAVMIYMGAKDADEVLDAAVLGFEEHGLPVERIICLSTSSNGNGHDGVRSVYVRGGNGHFDIETVDELTRILRDLGKLEVN